MQEARFADLVAGRVAKRVLATIPKSEPTITQLPPVMKKSEFAAMLGVSRPTVSNWIKAGKVKVTPSGRITAAEARRHGL